MVASLFYDRRIRNLHQVIQLRRRCYMYYQVYTAAVLSLICWVCPQDFVLWEMLVLTLYTPALAVGWAAKVFLKLFLASGGGYLFNGYENKSSYLVGVFR